MENLNIDKAKNLMDSINYGWMDINNEIHINTIENIQTLYRLATIDEMLKHKIGICFDQVELERYLFNEDYKTYSYAIFTNHMIHAFLILERDNKFIYFENSSYKNKGVYYFNSMEDAVEKALKDFIIIHKIKNIDKVKLVNYQELKPMTTFSEIKEILLNEKDISKVKI